MWSTIGGVWGLPRRERSEHVRTCALGAED